MVPTLNSKVLEPLKDLLVDVLARLDALESAAGLAGTTNAPTTTTVVSTKTSSKALPKASEGSWKDGSVDILSFTVFRSLFDYFVSGLISIELFLILCTFIHTKYILCILLTVAYGTFDSDW